MEPAKDALVRTYLQKTFALQYYAKSCRTISIKVFSFDRHNMGSYLAPAGDDIEVRASLQGGALKTHHYFPKEKGAQNEILYHYWSLQSISLVGCFSQLSHSALYFLGSGGGAVNGDWET